MPLLGRLKTATASSSAPSADASQSPPTGSRPTQGQVLLCESPLFGTRKQIVSSANSAPNSEQPNYSQPQPAASPVEGAATSELSSIPQRITRQQIHYAFSIIDFNHDGLIDVADLSQTLSNLGVPIDEAILSHVMSSASKRADRRISETEFLDWIGHFIQVSSDETPLDRPCASAARRKPGTGSALLATGPTAPDVQVSGRHRRGSGSGLSLMRSLSSTSTGATQPSAPSPLPVTSSSVSGLQTNSELTEAKNDLRAAFCVFDLDGDGFITLDEVQAGLKLLGESWTQAEIRQLFSKCSHRPSRASSTGAERISIEDFVQLLL